jgi:thiamine-phosphate pyrophosphorylase
VFASQTKSFDNFAGLTYLKQVAAEIQLPTFAIGGISATNVPEVLATGVKRVAVSGAITRDSEPASAARDLLSMLNAADC